MNTDNLTIKTVRLPTKVVSDFFWNHDNDYFEKLSDRIDIDDYSKKIHENATHFVIYDEENVIGFSPCYFNNVDEKKAYISSLTIRDGYRRSKLGSRLLTAIKQYADKKGFSTLLVSVHSDNQGSINFYKKNNFKVGHINEDTKTCSLECLTNDETQGLSLV